MARVTGFCHTPYPAARTGKVAAFKGGACESGKLEKMKPFLPYPKQKAIRLKGKELLGLRRQVAERANYRCQGVGCGKYTPFSKGHMAHIKSKGSGGDDSLENTEWLCFDCHIANGHLKWRSDKGEK